MYEPGKVKSRFYFVRHEEATGLFLSWWFLDKGTGPVECSADESVKQEEISPTLLKKVRKEILQHLLGVHPRIQLSEKLLEQANDNQTQLDNYEPVIIPDVAKQVDI
jgi:hypothetical protein